MSERKTKGGRKKMIFTPKAPINDDIPIITDIPSNIKTSKAKPKLRIKRRQEDTVAFTAFANRKETNELISIKKEQADDLNFENEYDPQFLEAEENENKFDDDIMYVFSGIERGRCKILVDNDRVFYEEDGVLSEMVVKNIDHMNVVLMDENVKEIGSVYNAYTVCRNDL